MILNTIAERGANVFVQTRPSNSRNDPTSKFLKNLENQINIQLIENLHEKILITDTSFFRGSMNFTYSGLYLNDEHVEISSDRTEIAQAMVDAKQRWEENL